MGWADKEALQTQIYKQKVLFNAGLISVALLWNVWDALKRHPLPLMWCDEFWKRNTLLSVLCCILKDTEYALEEPGLFCNVCDNVFYIIITIPQPLLAGSETWTSSHLPPVHVQGWSRLNNQILVTSQIVNPTFTKRE